MVNAIIYWILFCYALLDAQTVVSGAVEGMKLALFVVVPSLFPFIFISLLCSNSISARKITLLRPIERVCGMPAGSGILFLLGVCGGYPVGAQCIKTAYKQGSITKKDAERILGFCNNAGPSFIFGMVGGVLKDHRLCLLLWFGIILSSIIVGVILPGKSRVGCRLQTQKSITLTDGLENAVQICCKLTGWVILFRSILSVAEKWLLYRLPSIWNTGIAGFLELSNGCVRLETVAHPLTRFLLCGAMLCFGGMCVHLQTKSVTEGLSLKYYFVGKTLQMLISLPILLFLWKITVAF